MSKRLSISMVGYHNTLPFIHGLEMNDQYHIIKDIPAKCIDYFIDGAVDLALVPVGALIDLHEDSYRIVTDYCIGCDGEVRTVCLFSNEPIESLQTIYLDTDSRSSVKLLEMIMDNYHNKSVNLIPITSYDQHLGDGEGKLLIGDKVFEREGKYRYTYDLGLEWKKHTGLPFVFAVWIARPHLTDKVITAFNQYLKSGVAAIHEEQDWNVTIPHIDFQEYFERYISYELDDRKKKAMQTFLEYLKSSVS